MRNSKTISDKNSILLYRVGPVLCCSPTRSVESVVVPPVMKKPPGVNDLRPGVFRHVNGIVNIVDLRVAFGADIKPRNSAGRIIIVNLKTGSPGFWVDEIIDVIELPDKGWGQLPVLIPRDIFERILLLNEKILLYCEFEKLNECRKIGYLREYIEKLVEVESNKDKTIPINKERQGEDSQLQSHKLVSGKNKLDEKHDAKFNLKKSLHAQSPLNSDSDSVPGNKIMPEPESLTSDKSLDINPQLQTGKNTAINVANDLKSNIGKTITSEAGSVAVGGVDKVAGRNRLDDIGQGAFSQNNDLYGKYMVNSEGHGPEAIAQSGLIQAEYSDDDSTWKMSIVLIIMALLLALAVFYFLDYNPSSHEPSVASRVIAEDGASLTDIEELVTIDARTTIAHDAVPEMNDHSDKVIITDTGLLKSKVELSADDAAYADPDSMLKEGGVSIEKDDEGYVILLDQSKGDSGEAVFDKVDGQGEVAPEIAKPEISQTPAVEKDLASEFVTKENELSELNNKYLLDDKALNNNVSRRQVIHIVVKGDTLWHIARRYIHNPYRYPELARLSNIRNPDLIYPGQRVKIIILGDL